MSHFNQKPFAPDTLVILDFIEFCYCKISQPIKGYHHEYYDHHHLSFDKKKGQQKFLEEINTLFARNGIAYELSPEGKIQRLASPVLREALSDACFASGNCTLDGYLEDARKKFLNPDIKVRKEALERLWDGWECLKTFYERDKKKSTAKLLSNAAPEKTFCALLDKESKELTDIGNNFCIRHSEIDQTPIALSAHVDYLFHRLFSLILLLLPRNNARESIKKGMEEPIKNGGTH